MNTRHSVSNRIPKAVIALGVVSFLTDLSSEMIYPLLSVCDWRQSLRNSFAN